jgi:hypothetical protein
MKKQFCKFGHDTWKTGRNSIGFCRVCARVATKKWELANVEKRRKSAKAWRDKNPTYKLDWWKNNPNVYSYSNTRSRAKAKGKVFTLTLEEFKKVTSSPCYYCGGPLPKRGGLDRIDNTKGYEPDNVLPCCIECNRHRSDTWTVEEAMVAITAVQEFRDERFKPKRKKKEELSDQI